jgi:hypothetical protein
VAASKREASGSQPPQASLVRDALLLGQEFLDLLLGFTLGALAEVLVADEAVGVDQVPSRPETLVIGVPGGVPVVQDHGVVDLRLADGLPDVTYVFLEAELRRVNADDLQSVVGVLLVQRVDVTLRVLAVVSGVGPELEQDDLLAGGFLYGDAVRVGKAERLLDLLRLRILGRLARDPLRIGDGRLRLLVLRTLRGSRLLGVV